MILVEIHDEDEVEDYMWGQSMYAPMVKYTCSCGKTTSFDYFSIFGRYGSVLRYCENCQLVIPDLARLSPGEKSPNYRLGLHGYKKR